MQSLNIVEVDPLSQDALALLREAAIEARGLYPDLIAADDPWPTNRPGRAGDLYLVAYRGGLAVACGALRRRASAVVEVRRMFVTRHCRRQGVASAVLDELERRAKQSGYAVMRLETGNRQTPAMALYASRGFERIASFDEYAQDPTSVCFEKSIAGAVAGDR